MAQVQPSINIEGIKKLLPHRYPFLMIDRVVSLTEKKPGNIVGRVCLARKNVTINEAFFSGHFPGQPVMPGVLILEAIAQAGALCCCGMPEDPPLKELFFVGSDNVRFKKPVLPGDTLELKVKMVKQKSSLYCGKGEAYVDSELAARADIMAYIIFTTY